ncbi:MAG: hypothetical protein IPH74_16150 [Bacteroidetes bacterium]|nr:hypothetical protein [Bacteroidota bacterium]
MKFDVLSGILVSVVKTKRSLLYLYRGKTSNFDKITLIYTGIFRPKRKITGIFNRIAK